MKIRLIAMAAVAAALIGGGAIFANTAFAAEPSAMAQRERHPEIRKAMRQLNAALNTMRVAADDFHGHKAAAMESTRKALNELQAALKSDRR